MMMKAHGLRQGDAVPGPLTAGASVSAPVKGRGVPTCLPPIPAVRSLR